MDHGRQAVCLFIVFLLFIQVCICYCVVGVSTWPPVSGAIIVQCAGDVIILGCVHVEGLSSRNWREPTWWRSSTYSMKY